MIKRCHILNRSLLLENPCSPVRVWTCNHTTSTTDFFVNSVSNWSTDTHRSCGTSRNACIRFHHAHQIKTQFIDQLHLPIFLSRSCRFSSMVLSTSPHMHSLLCLLHMARANNFVHGWSPVQMDVAVSYPHHSIISHSVAYRSRLHE